MQDRKFLTSGGVAEQLGINRDSLFHAFSVGCPSPQIIFSRRIYSIDDIREIHAWFVARGRKVTRPAILDEQEHAAIA